MSEAPKLLPCPFCGSGRIANVGLEYASCSDCSGRANLEDWNTRADHALVAEACEGMVNQAVDMADGRDEAAYIEDRMRDAIPADAIAAREARDEQVREQALREILALAEIHRDKNWHPTLECFVRDLIEGGKTNE